MPLRTPSHRLGACPPWAEAAHDRSCLASLLIMSRPSLEFQLWFEFYTFYSNLQWQPQNTWGLIHQTMRHSRGFGPDENVVQRNQCLVWCCSVLVCCGNISVTFQFKDKASPPATVFCFRFHQSQWYSEFTGTTSRSWSPTFQWPPWAQKFENYFINLNWADKPGDRFLI